ncbi:MAG TPA: phage integrase SAM-like domain-containing protein, partial [Salegentibacter sp.]|uniref:phage integrase SAM-like domain-containing protein n=1 Tax=Salegentibacter sp. TaxID=1903072 RepID=UPI002F924C3E
METRAKGTVRFAFKSKNEAAKNKKEEFYIYLFFTYGSQRLKYGTGIKARYDEWDFKKQRLKNITRKYKDEDNNYLDDISSAIIDVYKEGARDAENISPLFLRNRLKSYLKNETREKTVQSKLTFTELIDKYITYKKGSIAPVTIRVYNQALNLIKEFESHFGRKLELEEINPTFHKNFTYF